MGKEDLLYDYRIVKDCVYAFESKENLIKEIIKEIEEKQLERDEILKFLKEELKTNEECRMKEMEKLEKIMKEISFIKK